MLVVSHIVWEKSVFFISYLKIKDFIIFFVEPLSWHMNYSYLVLGIS